MTDKKLNLGFVGAGRMATALARGCLRAGILAPDGLAACDPNEAARKTFVDTSPQTRVVDSNQLVLQQAECIVLAVKPQVMPEVLAEISESVEPRHLIVSIAAGITLARLADGLPAATRLIRIMPNTPCLIGQGASCYSLGEFATEADSEVVRRILESVGDAYEVTEGQLDAVTGLSGSGPAFVYETIGALAAGGERMGLSPELSLSLAAQTARGAAMMVQETGRSPADLRDQVASPNGTTVAGLASLARDDAPAAFSRAVEAATLRSIELGKE